ncbi:MAG: BT4734/BF3469 family protein [Prevotella sp.]|jgi:hypothetical protein
MRRFCISKDTVFARPAPHLQDCTPKLLNEVMNLPRVEYICNELHELAEKLNKKEILDKEFSQQKNTLKRNLPFWTPMASFMNGKRTLRDEHGNPNAIPSGLVMLDVDHVDDPRGLYDKISSKLVGAQVCLVHITPSWHGLRIIFPATSPDIVSSINQMAHTLGIEDLDVDKACKDLSRASFLVMPSMVLYRNDELLFSDTDSLLVNAQPTVRVATPTADGLSKAYDGVPYAAIIEEWFNANGRPVEGNRNTLLFKLACQLRYITDDNEDLIMSILPSYGLGETEMRQLIHHACSEAYRKEMPKAIKLAIAKARLSTAGLLLNNGDEDDQPLAMPERLPSLMKLLLKNTPDIYKPAVATAVFPPLATHLYNTWFRYLDGELHEATLMCCLMAPTGSGKSCITKPIDYIMEDIEQRDKASLISEQEWKEQVSELGSNDKKPPRPKVCVQEINPDITTAAFVMRLKQANGHFLFSRLNEIDQFDALKAGKLNEQFLIMCLAFDPNNKFGQTRVGPDAVSSQVCVRYNWVASTTVANGQRYFAKVLTNGPISRINFCTIPEREIGAPMPIYGTYDDNYRIALIPYINHLNAASGEISCPQAVALTKRLMKHTSDTAVLTQNRVYENLSYRALVIAYLKACLLYVANGRKWEPEIEDFISWSLDYDLWCKMHFFGDAIAQASESYTKSKRGCKSLLDFLPNKFTIKQVLALRHARGMLPNREKAMLNNWKSRGFIKNVNETTWEKIKN